MVRVLVLVDEDVAEPLAVDVGDVREGAEQVHRLGDEVVEVERVGRLQPGLQRIEPRGLARQRVALPLELALLLCRQFGANQSVEGELAAI